MYTVKLYFPITANIFFFDEDPEDDDRTEIDSFYLTKFKSIFNERINDYQYSNGKGAEQFFFRGDSPEVADNLISMKWSFENWNDRIYGLVTVKLKKRISKDGILDLKDFITFQNADGFGAELQEEYLAIQDDAYINVHLWQPKGYFVKTEDEFKHGKEEYRLPNLFDMV